MTYGEKIQEMIAASRKIYEQAEYMRDIATLEEKKFWNDHRRIFYNAEDPMRKLLNSLDDDRFDMEI